MAKSEAAAAACFSGLQTHIVDVATDAHTAGSIGDMSGIEATAQFLGSSDSREQLKESQVRILGLQRASQEAPTRIQGGSKEDPKRIEIHTQAPKGLQ